MSNTIYYFTQDEGSLEDLSKIPSGDVSTHASIIAEIEKRVEVSNIMQVYHKSFRDQDNTWISLKDVGANVKRDSEKRIVVRLTPKTGVSLFELLPVVAVSIICHLHLFCR
jgi:hypothetical protein